MARFLIARLLQGLLVAWGVSTLVFLLLRLSGDPTLLMVPPGAPAEAIERLRHELGFDRPLLIQYLSFLADLLRGDVGASLVQSRPALQIVLERFPATLRLAGAALVLALLVALPAGIAAAAFRGTWIERASLLLALLGQAIPPFWLGLMLILFLSVRLQLLPSSGAETWQHLVLPALTLASLSMAGITRMTRLAFLEELDREYVRTARAKGVSRPRIIMAHLLRNAAIPILTLVSLDIANLLGGAVVTETIFAWPGVGRLAIEAIQARDYPVVQAVVLVGTGAFVVSSILADLLYSVVDPRIRLSG
jgi:peptide/nickel transport system permease protein